VLTNGERRGVEFGAGKIAPKTDHIQQTNIAMTTIRRPIRNSLKRAGRNFCSNIRPGSIHDKRSARRSVSSETEVAGRPIPIRCSSRSPKSASWNKVPLI